MFPLLRRAVMALAILCLPVSVPARAFTIDDLLRQETFGAQAVDPTGRWIVFEQRDPYDSGQRYDWYLHTSEALTRLRLIDLQAPDRVRPLLKVDPGPGVTLGPFSPSGARLAVYRLRGTTVTLGVVTVATGQVRWLAVTPERPDWGRGVQWLSDTRLLVINRPDGVPTWSYREGRASAERLPALWRASARGGVGRTVVGSGGYAAVRPRPHPRELLVVDVLRGTRDRLATGEFRDLEISPDRSRVALLEAGADIQPRADGPVQGLAGISAQALAVSVLDLRTHRRRLDCPGTDAAPHLLSWSPSGASLLVFARPSGTLWSEGKLLAIDAATGAARPVAGKLTPVLDLRPEIVRTAWMGEDIVVLAQPRAGARADWYRLSATGPVNLTRSLPTAPRQLQAIDAEHFTAIAGDGIWRVSRTGEALRLPTGPALPAEAPRTTAGTQRRDLVTGSGAWIATGAPAARKLQWLDTAGLNDVLDLPADAEPTLVASRPRQAALVSERDAKGVMTLRLVSPASPPRIITRINTALADVPPPIVRPVRHAGPDGRILTSWLYLPPTPGPRPPPLVVQAYEGLSYPVAPRDYPGERGFLINIQTLVGHGYAVLVASLPLPKTQPDPMADLGGRLGGIVDAVAADPDLSRQVDLERVALWGQSYGGYTVMAAIAQTDRFRAAVALSGLSDLISKWETMPAVYRAAPEEGLHNNWSSGSVESGQDQMGAPPWVDPDRYIRNSPLFLAPQIKTPLLLIHGDQDVVPLTQSEAMFQALYRQNKDAMLITYFGEGHVIVSPGNVRDLYRRAFAFLDAQFSRRGSASAATPPANPAPAPASGAPRLRW